MKFSSKTFGLFVVTLMLFMANQHAEARQRGQQRRLMGGDSVCSLFVMRLFVIHPGDDNLLQYQGSCPTWNVMSSIPSLRSLRNR